MSILSGTIAITAGDHWSAAGWLFDWVLEFLAQEIKSEEAASSLREVVNENLGWLDISDFRPEDAEELRQVIAEELLAAANAQLPRSMSGRSDAIALLAELVSKAGRQR